MLSDWGTELVRFTSYLRAAQRSAPTIRLRTYYIARLAQEIQQPDPYAVTLDDLVDWLASSEWKPETRKSARSSIIAFYDWAERTERISPRRNPARRLPPVSVPRGAPRPAPDNRLMKALRAANDRDRLMVMLAAYAGLRRAEIAAVHPDDIDWKRDLLRVTGTGEQVRWVPLHPELREELRAELFRRQCGSCGTGYRYRRYLTADGHLFAGRDGHVKADVPGRVLSKLLGGDWTARTLRHRFATEAYAAEHDLHAVQELLGHSTPDTTARWVQAAADAKRVAVRAAGVRP